MSNQEKLQYARSRLGLARMMGDQSEVEKWREHVAFWEAAEQGVQLTGNGRGESDGESSPAVSSN
jgi:hypothetical protein